MNQNYLKHRLLGGMDNDCLVHDLSDPALKKSQRCDPVAALSSKLMQIRKSGLLDEKRYPHDEFDEGVAYDVRNINPHSSDRMTAPPPLSSTWRKSCSPGDDMTAEDPFDFSSRSEQEDYRYKVNSMLRSHFVSVPRYNDTRQTVDVDNSRLCSQTGGFGRQYSSDNASSTSPTGIHNPPGTEDNVEEIKDQHDTASQSLCPPQFSRQNSYSQNLHHIDVDKPRCSASDTFSKNPPNPRAQFKVRSVLEDAPEWNTSDSYDRENSISQKSYAVSSTKRRSEDMRVCIKEEPIDDFSGDSRFCRTQSTECDGGGKSSHKSEQVTSSGRNRGAGKANEPKFECQICTDVAAGYHCGAYVCEACKKFYLRCLKSEATASFVCPKNSDCEITKETRSHCQYCRFQKCLRLNMYKPGREIEKQLKVDFKEISCKVCEAPSSGYHFGAITCEGCKGFFRRMLKEQLHRKFACSSQGNCDITMATRTTCKSCRFKKCVEVGMALQGTRLGRQSNSVKRMTLLDYQKLPFKDPVEKPPTLFTHLKTEVSETTSVDITRTDGPRVSETMEIRNDDAVDMDTTSARSRVDPWISEVRDVGFNRGPMSSSPPYTTRASTLCGTLQNDPSTSYHNVPHEPCTPPHHNVQQIPADDQTYHNAVSHSSRRTLSHSSSCSSSGYAEMAEMYPADRPASSYGRLPDTQMSQFDNNSPNLSTTPISPFSDTPPAQSEVYPPTDINFYKNKLEKKCAYFMDIFSQLATISERPEEMENLEASPLCPDTVWQIIDLSFLHHAKYIIHFVKQIPGVTQLSLNDQALLTKESLYPISLSYHSQKYDMATKHYNWFINTEWEKQLILKTFPELSALGSHLATTGHLLKVMNLDIVEYSLLTALIVTSPGNVVLLEDRKAVEAIEDQLLSCLQDYLFTIKHVGPNRLGSILARLPELHRAALAHNIIARELHVLRPTTHFSQLWNDLFTE